MINTYAKNACVNQLINVFIQFIKNRFKIEGSSYFFSYITQQFNIFLAFCGFCQ